jgi:hypothetical protein
VVTDGIAAVVVVDRSVRSVPACSPPPQSSNTECVRVVTDRNRMDVNESTIRLAGILGAHRRASADLEGGGYPRVDGVVE